MKINIFFTYCIFLSFLVGVLGCQKVEDLTPSTSREGINSITASFMNDESTENLFESEIDHQNRVITIVFPYNYPRTSNNVLTTANLVNVRVKANLDDNVTVSPALLYLDLTKENYIDVTDQAKTVRRYKIVAEIRKSRDAFITNFDLSSLGLNGIVDEASKTISLISIESIGSVLANVSISHGATISPDPAQTPLNYDADIQLTVTAQDGVTKSVYTVKKAVPAKTTFGLRSGSAKVLWAKKINSELGISTLNLTTGIAATKDYLVVNTRTLNSIYLDRKTGQIAGSVNLGSIAGNLTNFYHTADENNNILVCNLAPNAGAFKVWRIKGVTGTPQEYIEWNDGQAIGRKLSVKGNLDGNAIITAAILGTGNKFARWKVVNGTLQSQTPEVVTITGLGGAWNNNADIVQTSATDASSDYFVSYYAAPYRFAWINGATNTVKALGPEISSNWIQNAADYAVFNNAPYAVHNSINSFTWGSDDAVHLYDVSSTATFGSAIWKAPIGIYGGKDNGGQNANGTGDVALQVSDNGYYMYLYFMFTNGQVACVQFDCIDM
ncbi:MAG: DUF5018 domain-containing protein [Niabella sp.]